MELKHVAAPNGTGMAVVLNAGNGEGGHLKPHPSTQQAASTCVPICLSACKLTFPQADYKDGEAVAV